MFSADEVTKPPPSYQLTPRDMVCLTWIALQYAIRFDQLRCLLYRHTPQQDRYKLKPGVASLSVDRTYEIIDKWRCLGLIETKIILHGDKVWIWPNRQGLRTVQLAFHYSGQPSSSRLPHLYYSNQVRLAVEERRPHDTWKSERQIRKEAPVIAKGEHQPHIPDAILYAATGKITAIEVECHAKNETELGDDLRELAVSYKSIWYFTTPATRRQIEGMLSTFSPEMQKPFVLYDLAEYGHAYGIS